jgi:hypothetical protein
LKTFSLTEEEHVSLLFKQAKDTILELRKTIESAAPEVRANLTELNTKLAQDRAEWKKDGLDEEECFQKEEEYLKQRLSEEQMALEGILPVDRSIMDRYQRYQAQVFPLLIHPLLSLWGSLTLLFPILA